MDVNDNHWLVICVDRLLEIKNTYYQVKKKKKYPPTKSFLNSLPKEFHEFQCILKLISFRPIAKKKKTYFQLIMRKVSEKSKKLFWKDTQSLSHSLFPSPSPLSLPSSLTPSPGLSLCLSLSLSLSLSFFPGGTSLHTA